MIRFTACLADLPRTHGVHAACVVPDWVGLDRAHAQLAAMGPEDRSATPPRIPPEELVAAVLDLVHDDTRSDSIVELWGGEQPHLVPPVQGTRGSKP